MSVCAFDFDDIRKEDPFRDLGSNVNPITWPSVHVGHCVLSWNKYLIVFGGFTTIFSRNAGFEGVDDSRYHSTRRLWFYDVESCEWILEDTYGESPPSLSSAACAIVNDCIYVFCGYSKANYYNEKAYRLDLLTKIWRRVFPCCDQLLYPITEPHPSGRDKLSSFVHQGSIYLFGGYGSVPSFSSELYGHYIMDSDREALMDLKAWFSCLVKFSVETNHFSLVPTKGEQPPPRAACAGCKLGDTFYIFGGRLSNDRMKDFYSLDMKTFTWSRIWRRIDDHEWPNGRSWAVLSPIGQLSQNLLLQGGLDSSGNTLSDFWVYNIPSRKWKELTSLKARQFWHAGSTIKDSVYLFGGFKHANVHSRYEVSSSELMKVSITPNTLHSLAAESIATFIVASHENYENDTRWNLLNEFLMPKDITFIQKTAKRLFYLKCHNAKQAFSTPPSSA